MNANAPQRRNVPRTPHRRSALGGTLVGVFIGIIVGLGMAASVAYWLMKNNPALTMPVLAREAPAAVREVPTKVAKAETEKPRFDFYKILPGVEEPKVQPERRNDRGDRAVAEQSKDRGKESRSADASPPRVPDKAPSVETPQKIAKVAQDRFWLQAGSFSSPPDAENLRARLALAGWEASVQEGALPDKSIRYRVRLGPYDNPDELGRMKTELASRGFDVAVIRN